MPKSEMRKKRLEFLMKRQGYTFKGLGDELGVSEKTLRNYRDGGNLSLNTLIDLAEFFEVSTDYLIGADLADNSDFRYISGSDILVVLEQSYRIIDEQSTALSIIAKLASHNKRHSKIEKREVKDTIERLDSIIEFLRK